MKTYQKKTAAMFSLLMAVSVAATVCACGKSGAPEEKTDIVPPEIVLVLPAEVTEGTQVTVSPAVTDDISAAENITVSVSVKKDGAEVPLTDKKFLAERGTYTVSVVATDEAGNSARHTQVVQGVEEGVTITDTKAPVILFTPPENVQEGDTVTLRVRALDDYTPEEEISLTLTLTLNDEDVELTNNTFTASYGTYSLTVKATDASANTATETFTFDSEPDPARDDVDPTVELSLPASVYMYDLVEIAPVCTDDKTKSDELDVDIEVTLDGAPVSLEDNAFYAKQGTYSVTVTATDKAGNTGTATKSITATRFVYSARQDYANNVRLVVANETDSAEYYLYCKYETDGLSVLIDALDGYICTSNADIGMNDNVELQFAPLTTEVYSQNVVKIMANPVTKAGWVNLSDGTGWSENLYDFFVPSGDVQISSELATAFKGYTIGIKVSYELLGTSYEAAKDRMTVSFSARNTARDNKSSWTHCSALAAQWTYANTWMRIRTDGKIEKWSYDFPSIDTALEASGGMHEHMTYADNRADLGLVEKEETFFRDYKPAENFYTDIAPSTNKVNFNQIFAVAQNGYWEGLEGSSYVYGSQFGGYTVNVDTAGYVVAAISGETSNREVVNAFMAAGWSVLATGMPSVRKHATDFYALECSTTYLVKWCEAGDKIVSPGSGMIFFGAHEENSYVDEWVKTSPAVYHITSEQLVRRYGYLEDGLGFAAVPSVAVTPRDDGGKRIWSFIVDGGTTEPHGSNYMALYYSDDDAASWKLALAVDMPETDECEFWSNSPMGNLNDYTRIQEGTIYYAENSLYLFVNPGINYHDNLMGVWWTKITNPGIALNSYADSADLNVVNKAGEKDKMTRICNGLANNSISPVSITDGDTTYKYMFGAWMVGGDRSLVNIYVSTDMEDWVYWSSAHVNAATCWTEVSFAQGKDYDGEDCLYMTYRGNQGYYHGREVSYNNGKTWKDEGEYLRGKDGKYLQTTSSKARLYRLSSGNLLLIYNYDNGARTDLAAFLSTDGGATFTDHVLVFDTRFDERDGCSYPSVAEYGGELYITWDYGRNTIGEMMYLKITEADLLSIDGVKVDDSLKQTMELMQPKEVL